AALGTAGGGAIVGGLAVAAETGTLARRFTGTPAANRLRAKTGSLSGVVGLAGRIGTATGHLDFALLANDLPRDAAGFGLQDRVATLLAGFPDAPPPGALGPLAAAATTG
ncbi:MAG: D-alanyl-D-alanine carboxypeptidase, partial [Acidimicrobiales bacterium]